DDLPHRLAPLLHRHPAEGVTAFGAANAVSTVLLCEEPASSSGAGVGRGPFCVLPTGVWGALAVLLPAFSSAFELLTGSGRLHSAAWQTSRRSCPPSRPATRRPRPSYSRLSTTSCANSPPSAWPMRSPARPCNRPPWSTRPISVSSVANSRRTG